MNQKELLLDRKDIHNKINRIAYQILEDNLEEKVIHLVGIKNNGFIMAEKIHQILQSIAPFTCELSALKINKKNALLDAPSLSIDNKLLEDHVVILIDDVLNSGSTLIYGVKYLLNYSLKRLSTAVLIDRNHKRFPIGIHYKGISLSTTLKNHIEVDFSNSEDEKAYLL